MIAIISTVVGLVLVVWLVLNYHPVFGSKVTKAKLQAYEQSANFRAKKFINQIPTAMNSDFETTRTMLRDLLRGNPNRRPAKSFPLGSVEFPRAQSQNQTKVTWFGHSALMLEVDGKTLLLDPMFGKAPSPFPVIGGKRYSRELPFKIDELPMIDAVVLSHDHYDHLDYGSIKKIKDKVRQFIVPLGVGGHLERWGVDPNLIQEHDWWDEFDYEGIQLACTPARHFSGRSLSDRNATLWCSWVIAGTQTKVYFSGDSGYGPHFQEIGDKYGPFDLTFMECGQYDARWAAIHMMPEETVQAHLDVRGNVMIPIHWAAFTLGFHEWTDPVERVTKSARERDVEVATPMIGETVTWGAKYPTATWWK
ncbi:MBL fold metallo-hydrolase [Tumebacillus permanentifrigoris]|uniref:L-ascorbate metabolism protein UlaG (Beta-lactamase superfamily) n=1 Tax=Tumebacillus permanentifrigoris TaxID=378543 RepID=A0A316DIQ6_9BACL|nr:MBL fold metallo-hydrolase [Tumebacillus permanentifrigoris]PWK16513.1 L-ascorbate metabolism protein UlaG (beta-lactamase superfamily) [Tumebacillus permanentifrigoris]